jgi:hypothetical protein
LQTLGTWAFRVYRTILSAPNNNNNNNVIKFLRHLLGITKLDKEKNQYIREKTGVQNKVKEIKQYQKKVATTCKEDGHK